MSKRYYLCDIIGDGQSPDTAFRPAVADLGVNYAVTFPPKDPQTGQYQSSTCLVLVATNDHVSVVDSGLIDQFPDASLDIEWASIDRNKRGAIESAIARRNLTAPKVDPGDGMRVFIRGIGKGLDPNFHEDNFDVSE